MTLSNRKCPICGKPRNEEFHPFCGARCKDRDLVRWLDDGYALPGPPVINEDDEKNVARELPSDAMQISERRAHG